MRTAALSLSLLCLLPLLATAAGAQAGADLRGLGLSHTGNVEVGIDPCGLPLFGKALAWQRVAEVQR